MKAKRWRDACASMLVRNKSKIIDAAILAAATVLELLYAYEADVFYSLKPAGTASAPAKHTIELNEALAVSALFSLGLAIYAIRRSREARRESARRLVAEREAKTLAMHDALTGLPNRRHFNDALKTTLATSPQGGGVHAVLMMDLNGFKHVNDMFGHAVGDEVLIHVGARLSRAVRQCDVAARFGGDEFAILATHLTGPEAATSLARRIMESLQRPIVAGSCEHTIGVGIGIAVSPQDSAEPTELLRQADIALYRAKEQPQSSLRFFEQEMDAQVRERDHLERVLRAATGAETLEVFYQPQVDMRSGEILGFEALARWTDPVLGEVKPERFIPVAEDAGLISKLTDSLLERACGEAATWPKSVMLSFNISPLLISDQTLALRIVNILDRTGLPFVRLELEITESALVRDLEAAKTTLGMLRAAGVRIALDDFGTGCSSLYHLLNFKLDKIKIDRSFVARIDEDGDSARVVSALIGLGTGLGLAITAEGVETPAQQRLLRAHGCEQAQGFLYSAAVDAASIPGLLSAGSPDYQISTATA